MLVRVWLTFVALVSAMSGASALKFTDAGIAYHKSKRAVLKAAWGGVVNEDGKTPKTQRWLDEALGQPEGAA